MPEPLPLLPEGLATRYRLQKCLQHREGCQTFLAQALQRDQPVIIKCFTLAPGVGWEALDLFEREAKTLRNIQHPRIPRLIETFRCEAPLAIYLIQEAVQAQSLREKLDAHGPFSEAQVKIWAKAVLDILTYLHGIHPPIIHRDIKPENLLVQGNDIFLIDFGAVRDTTLSQNMTVAGTFGYMPPEQSAGYATPETDLYALGITLVECLSGKSPHLFKRDTRLRLLFHDALTISPVFQRWLDVMTDPDPRLRPPTAAQALAWLDMAALPETLGRLTRVYPAPGVQELIIAPSKESPALSQAAKRTLTRTLVPMLPIAFGNMVIWRLLVGNGPAFPSLGAWAMIFLGALLIPWCVLMLMDYRVLQQNAQCEHRFKIHKGKMTLNEQAPVILSQLSSLDFGNQLRLRFKSGQVITLPVSLTLEEKQLLTHILEQDVS